MATDLDAEALIEPTWETREKVVLRAIVEAENAGQDPTKAARAAADLDEQAFMLCIDRLHRAGFIDAAILRARQRPRQRHHSSAGSPE